MVFFTNKLAKSSYSFIANCLPQATAATIEYSTHTGIKQVQYIELVHTRARHWNLHIHTLDLHLQRGTHSGPCFYPPMLPI